MFGLGDINIWMLDSINVWMLDKTNIQTLACICLSNILQPEANLWICLGNLYRCKGILYNLALSLHESYFQSHAIQENAFERMVMIICTLTMTLVHVWTVLVKTTKKYVGAKLDTQLPRALVQCKYNSRNQRDNFGTVLGEDPTPYVRI